MRLLLSGGGTGGHIVPNIALIRGLTEQYGKDFEPLYLGETGGMEQSIAVKEGVPFKGILCGKLRRYFSWSNFVDLLKIPVGIAQAYAVIRRFKPDMIFCKGGYVSFPAAVAGKLAGVPVVLHESDVVPGLSNRMAARFATVICIAYEESTANFPRGKTVVTGNPVRKEITRGRAENGRRLCGFTVDLPVLLVTGGSQGAEAVNGLILDNLRPLLTDFNVAHICGKGKMRTDNEIIALLGEDYRSMAGRYKSFEFVNEEMKDLYALCDAVVSRAGAMTLAEIAAVGKPAVLIPLGRQASRGDQIVNARAFVKSHRAVVLEEGEFVFADFLEGLKGMIGVQRGSGARAADGGKEDGGEKERVDGKTAAKGGNQTGGADAVQNIINVLEKL